MVEPHRQVLALSEHRKPRHLTPLGVQNANAVPEHHEHSAIVPDRQMTATAPLFVNTTERGTARQIPEPKAFVLQCDRDDVPVQPNQARCAPFVRAELGQHLTPGRPHTYAFIEARGHESLFVEPQDSDHAVRVAAQEPRCATISRKEANVVVRAGRRDHRASGGSGGLVNRPAMSGERDGHLARYASKHRSAVLVGHQDSRGISKPGRGRDGLSEGHDPFRHVDSKVRGIGIYRCPASST